MASAEPSSTEGKRPMITSVATQIGLGSAQGRKSPNPHASRLTPHEHEHEHEHDWRSKSCTLETGKMGLENTINRYAGSMQRAGLPTHLERAGMLRINVEPAPTIAHAPISMPGMTEQPIPNMAPAPTRTLPAMCVPGAI